MTFQTTVKYVFVIMKLDVPRFLEKKTNILHFYSVHKKKTFIVEKKFLASLNKTLYREF